MAEIRQKTHSILLNIRGKNVNIELFEAALWPDKTSTDDLFRLRIDGCWYMPNGKYTFLSLEAVGSLVIRLLSGQEDIEEAQSPVFKIRDRVAVAFGECLSGVPLRITSGRVVAASIKCFDGQWRVPVSTYEGTDYYPVYDVEKR